MQKHEKEIVFVLVLDKILEMIVDRSFSKTVVVTTKLSLKRKNGLEKNKNLLKNSLID